MSREAAAKTRDGNEIEFSRIVAFSDGVFSIAVAFVAPTVAQLMWFVLFFDPTARIVARATS
jgi:hypothetical protein